MHFEINWILINVLPLLGFIILISFIKFQIKGATKAYFFDGSLNIENSEHLPNDKTKKKLSLNNAFIYSIQAVIIVAVLLVITTSVEEKNINLPSHTLDILIIVFIFTFIISFNLYSEYFDFFRNDLKEKLNNLNRNND